MIELFEKKKKTEKKLEKIKLKLKKSQKLELIGVWWGFNLWLKMICLSPKHFKTENHLKLPIIFKS